MDDHEMTDWRAWHMDYADPDSALSQRLRVVQGAVVSWLDGHVGPAHRAGLRERQFVAPDGTLWSVGIHDLVTAAAAPLPEQLFTFEA
jgi:hypothetical protein